MKWINVDGGRLEAGFKGETDDCVTRSIAIVTGLPYKEVYQLVNDFSKKEYKTKRRKKRSSARTGVHKATTKKIMNHLGYEWIPTMLVGQGCKVHLTEEELPMGRLLVSLSKHITAVIDGIIFDTFDPSRNGTRCVYGYWIKR